MNKICVFFFYVASAFFFIGLSVDYQKLVHELSHEGAWLRAAAELIAAMDIGSAVALALLAGFAAWDAKRDDEWITLVICYPDGHEVSVEDAFQREDCSRSEVHGLMRAHNHGRSYTVDFLNSKELRAELKRVKSGDAKHLKVRLSETDDFRDLKRHLPEPALDQRPKAFWNISNHPLTGWSEAQVEEARALSAGDAELIDVPFPMVEPALSTRDIKAKADELLKTWVQRIEEGPHQVKAALVTGEPIMSYYLSQGLCAHGVKCYVATSQRIAEELDGVKRSRFEFVRFREWPLD